MIEIKGSNLEISKKLLIKRYGEETFKKVIDKLPEDERALMAGQVWGASWYSLDLFIHWAAAIQEVIFKDDREGQLKFLVIPTIDEQFKSTYDVYRALGSPDVVLEQLATITRGFLRGVTVEVKMLGPTSALLRYVGFEKHHRPIEVTIRAFWQRMLGTMPSKDFRFETVTSIGAGQGCGEYKISWHD